MRILFILTSSIAIKKSLRVIEKLTLKKIIIDCILTNNAKKLIKINELKKIIKGKIFYNDFIQNKEMLHISLTRKSDLIVVCPATANIIAKFSNGYADDLASTSLIASDKKILVVPAMNSEMWNNAINQKNVLKLINSGIEFIGPEYGKLSCGEVGLGRLSEPEKIYKSIFDKLQSTKIFQNKNCLITAGPTIEPIDSIRYFTNYSSGKQGYEIAKQMILSGANVTLISGPTNLPKPSKVKLINVNTAQEMYNAVKKNSKVDIAIFTAAVVDVRPEKKLETKIKKQKLKNIKLVENKDILSNFSKRKKNRPKTIIGFAAETNNHLKNAKIKLKNKKCDAIIVNKINKKNIVFGSDFNKVSFVTKERIVNIKKMTKTNIAKKIIQLIDKL